MGKMSKLRVTPRYAVLLFIIIVMISASLSAMLLSFAADRFETYELQKAETSLQLAADDLENQLAIFADIAYRIQVTSYYKPATIRLDAYREVVLLKDFVYFMNFSPLLNRYFLVYPDLFLDQQKIFTSDGNTSYFQFYSPSALGISKKDADALYRSIADARTRTHIVFDEHILLLYPIKYVETQMPDSRAVIAFILAKDQIVYRMEQVATDLPEEITVCIGADELFSTTYEQSQQKKISEKRHFLHVSSDEGVITLSAMISQDKWGLLNSALPSWLMVGFILAFGAVAGISILLARMISRPIQRLLDQYTPAGERLKNEFVQLEELVSRMVRENGNSIRQLRERTLQSILRGYYSESLLKHWGFLQFDFSKALYCTYIIDTTDETDEDIADWKRMIEQQSDENVCYYAVRIPEDRVLVIIAGYNEAGTAANLRLEALLQGKATICSFGQECDAPQRLSTSYLGAMNAHLQALEQQVASLPDTQDILQQLISTAERGDSAGMQQIYDEMLLDITGTVYSRTLVRNTAAQIMTELSALASKRRVSLDQMRLNMLLLLPTMELLLSDTFAFIMDTFFRENDDVLSRSEINAQAIADYVTTNASAPDIDLSQVAEHFGLSNDYISLMIRKSTGVPFKEYLTDIRLEKAREMLLTHPEMTVNDISLAVGYRKTSNFIKKFKEAYGTTPAQYR